MTQRARIITTMAALAVAGCSHKEGGENAHEAEPGISFQAKHGLLVPQSTAKFIGLRIADIEKRKVTSSLQFSAQVYWTVKEGRSLSIQPGADASALASGIVGQSQAASLRVGQPATAEIESGASLTGHVASLNHAFEKASGQVEVLVAIDDAQGRLTKGAFVSVAVPLGGEQNAVTVPRSALLRTTEGDFVYTVSGERFVRAPVKLGVINQEFAEVIDGLFEGDKIVVNPVMTLWMAELQSIRGGKACADGH